MNKKYLISGCVRFLFLIFMVQATSTVADSDTSLNLGAYRVSAPELRGLEDFSSLVLSDILHLGYDYRLDFFRAPQMRTSVQLRTQIWLDHLRLRSENWISGSQNPLQDFSGKIILPSTSEYIVESESAEDLFGFQQSLDKVIQEHIGSLAKSEPMSTKKSIWQKMKNDGRVTFVLLDGIPVIENDHIHLVSVKVSFVGHRRNVQFQGFDMSIEVISQSTDLLLTDFNLKPKRRGPASDKEKKKFKRPRIVTQILQMGDKNLELVLDGMKCQRSLTPIGSQYANTKKVVTLQAYNGATVNKVLKRVLSPEFLGL